MRTLGVEEELLLVDPTTGVPTAVAGQVLQAERSDAAEVPGQLEVELQQQQIETGTEICRTLTEVEAQVRTARDRADRLARASGAWLVALGTSPLPTEPDATPQPRYLRMVEHFGLTTIEQLTCGCHVHVAVASREEGVAVLDRVRIWLPALLALSANSPFWQGRDSGYASFRSQAWTRFPGAGPTDLFGSTGAYERRVNAMVDSGVLLDRHMIYFDARLADQYPTVEIRIADVCLDPRDTVMIAGLIRALVDTAAAEWSAGAPAPAVPTELIRLATWRAGRSGLGGDLLDPWSSRPRPAAVVVEALLDHVAEALAANQDLDLVRRRARTLMVEGTGADLQRRIHSECGDLREVVRRTAEQTTGG